VACGARGRRVVGIGGWDAVGWDAGAVDVAGLETLGEATFNVAVSLSTLLILKAL